MEKLNNITIDAYEFKLKYIFEKIFKFTLYLNDDLIMDIRDLTKVTYKERLYNFKTRLNDFLEPMSFVNKRKAFEYTIEIYGNPKHFNIKLHEMTNDNINEQLKLYFIAKINDEIEDFMIFQKYNNKFCKVLTRTSDRFFRMSFMKKVYSININFHNKVINFFSNLLNDYYHLNIVDVQLIKDQFYISVVYNSYLYLCDELPRSLSERILVQYSKDEYYEQKKKNPLRMLSLIKKGRLIPVFNFNEKLDLLKNNLTDNTSSLLSSIQDLFEDNDVDKKVFDNFVDVVQNSPNQSANIEQLQTVTNENNQKNDIIMNLINRVIGDKDIDLNDTNMCFFIMELVNGLIEINSPNRNVYLFMNDANIEEVNGKDPSQFVTKQIKEKETSGSDCKSKQVRRTRN